jgi:hypothetical protein
MTERQSENVFRRFERGLARCAALIDQAFCSAEMKVRYHDLVSWRWQQLR